MSKPIAAFTLIEVLASVALIGALMVMLLMVLDDVQGLRAAAEPDEADHAARRLAALIEQDLQHTRWITHDGQRHVLQGPLGLDGAFAPTHAFEQVVYRVVRLEGTPLLLRQVVGGRSSVVAIGAEEVIISPVFGDEDDGLVSAGVMVRWGDPAPPLAVAVHYAQELR
jgi:hypothetical protein